AKRGIAVPNAAAADAPLPAVAPISDPMAIHIAAQDRAVASGGTLVPEELAKREKNPFDMWDEMAANAAAGRFPKGLDVFRHKFHGLFYVAPNQDAFMLRLRLPGGILLAHQATGLGDIAERFGGGRIGMLEDTNDIGFAAVRVGSGKPLPDGVYFRLLLGGLTGHGSFARDSGVLLEPGEVVAAAAVIVRAFIDHGDRTDRKKARLKYLIDRWGIDKLMAEAARHLPAPWRFVPAELCEKRGPIDREAHIGIHPQQQLGLFYIGILAPASRLTAAQL